MDLCWTCFQKEIITYMRSQWDMSRPVDVCLHAEYEQR